MMLDLGLYPGVVDGEDVIKGELYAVPDRIWAELDAFEGAPALFCRKKIQLSDGTGSWIYVLNTQGHLSDRMRAAIHVESGDWRQWTEAE
jgi:gamma-glutamylcyclotransferase (GGCT)/AIG2-like uncharacterized protein YtfP